MKSAKNNGKKTENNKNTKKLWTEWKNDQKYKKIN